MKKIFLSSICIVFAVMKVAGQGATYLSEDFNTACVSTTGFATHWVNYNPIVGSDPAGHWTCAPNEGRGGSNGMKCTGYYGAVNHLDTSYLITPALDLSGYQGHIYLRFDTKTVSIHSGDRMSVLKVDTSFVASGGAAPVDISDSLLPVLGFGDSTWVRHQVDLIAYKNSGPVYIAFRYTSPTTSGNIWYLDNVNTDTGSLVGVHEINKTELPLKVIGTATSSQVTISYTTSTAGTYDLVLYDMMGRQVHKEQLNTGAGTYTYNIGDLSLHPGMYFVKMGNEATYATAKVIVP